MEADSETGCVRRNGRKRMLEAMLKLVENEVEGKPCKRNKKGSCGKVEVGSLGPGLPPRRCELRRV